MNLRDYELCKRLEARNYFSKNESQPKTGENMNLREALFTLKGIVTDSKVHLQRMPERLERATQAISLLTDLVNEVEKEKEEKPLAEKKVMANREALRVIRSLIDYSKNQFTNSQNDEFMGAYDKIARTVHDSKSLQKMIHEKCESENKKPEPWRYISITLIDDTVITRNDFIAMLYENEFIDFKFANIREIGILPNRIKRIQIN